MPREFVFNSAIGSRIRGFINEKQSMGYKYFNESKWMEKFDRYWNGHGYGDTGLTVENLEEWLQKRDCEGAKCTATRISVIREFSLYLNGLGIYSYYPSIDIRYTKPPVHVFTNDETKAVFREIDQYTPRNKTKDTLRLANEYPVLYRLIYCEGLRNSEASQLPARNVDLETGAITILDGKNNKDRIVYLSHDLLALCRDYFQYLCGILGYEPEWFFPGVDPQKAVSAGTVSTRFRESWKKTPYAGNCLTDPCVHSLRHTMITKRINLWFQQGISFDQMLPYLCKFLGHKSFRDTFYYFHYVEETARIVKEKDTTIGRVIPEVVRR